MTDRIPTPGTPIAENHRGSCHQAHPGVRHGEWERHRRGLDQPTNQRDDPSPVPPPR